MEESVSCENAYELWTILFYTFVILLFTHVKIFIFSKNLKTTH